MLKNIFLGYGVINYQIYLKHNLFFAVRQNNHLGLLSKQRRINVPFSITLIINEIHKTNQSSMHHTQKMAYIFSYIKDLLILLIDILILIVLQYTLERSSILR